MAKCRPLTPAEKAEWYKIQQLPESERVKAESDFVGKVMATEAKTFPQDDINFTEEIERPVAPRRDLTKAEVRENELTVGKPKYTLEQANALVGFFGEYISNPNAQTAWELTRELRREDRAGRAERFKARAQQLVVESDLTTEQALKQTISEALSGKYPMLRTEYLDEMTADLRDALFAKVYHTLSNEPFEMTSTITALTNALTGRPIPRDPGTTGRSAYTRLERVFGDQEKAFKAIEQGAESKQPLEDIVEGVYRIAGQPPIPINQEMADYLRGLSDISKQDPLFAPAPIALIDKVVGAVLPNMNYSEKQMIIRVLKEIGFSPIDIGNFLRASMATLDNSFLRQSKVLASGHPRLGFQGHTASWKAMFSQKSAEAEWELITRDPDYELYEQIRIATGHDPLRLPFFAMQKGTAQHRASEEFGFPNVERSIPRITSKLPHIKPFERAFVTGTNKIVWGVWKLKLKESRRYAAKVASGKVKLKEGESVDIVQEMTDQQSMLGNMIQRANLRILSGLAPATNAMFFSLRSKLGRFLLPKDLLGVTVHKGRVGFNRNVMKEAWKDWLLMNAYISGVLFLGSWLDLWDLEDDPRSGEFMSARIGNLRIDPWAGYRQFAVLYARLVTGTGISSVTSSEYDVDPTGALQSFFENSLAPLPSLLLDFWTGRNFLGAVVEVTDAKVWLSRITPFAVQDIWEAFEEGEREGIIAIVPAIFGEGVQTYTGNWNDNFGKLGTPKYQENAGYGLIDPVYDIQDLWADTASRFKDVSVEELTEDKGYPEFIRSMVETLNVLLPIVNDLPDTPLYQMNANPDLSEPTFIEYNNMWKDREKIVASGDKEALKAFDSNELTNDAYKGNITQAQYALLVQYNSQRTDEDKEKFLEKNPELKEQPRKEWLKSNPNENAQLAVWSATSRNDRVDLETSSAYDKARKIIDELEIPDSALVGIPSEKLGSDFKGYLDLLNSGITTGSDDAQFYRLIRPEYEEWYVKNWHGDGASPADMKVTERYSTSQIKKLVEDYEALPSDGKDRVLFRQKNGLLDAYFVYAKDYTPVVNSGWDNVSLSQILEWYKLGKGTNKRVTSDKKPQNPAIIWGPYNTAGGGGGGKSGGSLSDILD